MQPLSGMSATAARPSCHHTELRHQPPPNVTSHTWHAQALEPHRDGKFNTLCVEQRDSSPRVRKMTRTEPERFDAWRLKACEERPPDNGFSSHDAILQSTVSGSPVTGSIHTRRVVAPLSFEQLRDKIARSPPAVAS